MILPSSTGITRSQPSATGGGGGGGASIQSIVPEAVFDVDATQSASYGGSGQTWANLVPSPHDGSAQADYDMQLGQTSSASSDDPTFTGTAGTSGAYFSFDGGDVISLPAAPTYLRERHQTSKIFTLGYCVDIASAANQGMIGTGGDTGISWLFQGGFPRLLLQNVDGGSFTNNIIDTPGFASGVLCIIVAVDGAAGTCKAYMNGTKFTAPYSGAGAIISSSTDAVLAARYNSLEGIQFPLTNGSKCRSIFLIDKYITDTEASDLLAEMNSRHGSIY